MLVKELPDQSLSELLVTGLNLEVGPFTFQIRSKIPAIEDHIRKLYSDYSVHQHLEFVDFPVRIFATWGGIGPLAKVYFSFDGNEPFTPLPMGQSTAMLEWAMNWCVSSNAHQYLIIHSAVVAFSDQAIILPGAPGSGKSTLCAALVNAGARLLSDELTLVDVESGKIVSVPKPIGLKNESIEIIRNMIPNANLGRLCHDTIKGTVTHLGAPSSSLENCVTPVSPRLVIFPKYNASTENTLVSRSKGNTYMTLIENAFNYHLLGDKGFRVLSGLVDQVQGFDITYNDMDKAVETIKELVQ